MMKDNKCIIPTYDVLDEQQIADINKNSYLVKYKKNETIYRQKMPISNLIFIKSGLVKTFKEGDAGKKIILSLESTDSFVGLMSTFCRSQYEFSCTTLIDCEVVFTDFTVIRKIVQENGNYSLHLMKQISEQGLFIFNKLMNLSHKQVPGRIAGILLALNEMFKSDEFEIPLSRQELADLISATKESVSRTLSEFKHDKIIDVEEKRIIIKRTDILTMLSRIG
jgi:CRP/FNR family transcriptional regulator, polysaccharide utilization system transcription regulator